MKRGRGGQGEKASRPTRSADEGLARRTPPLGVIVTERRLRWPVSDRFRGLAFIPGSANAGAAEQEDVGVFNQPVGDGRGDGGVVENLAPVAEGCVCG
jgi:hypothetical protein